MNPGMFMGAAPPHPGGMGVPGMGARRGPPLPPGPPAPPAPRGPPMSEGMTQSGFPRSGMNHAAAAMMSGMMGPGGGGGRGGPAPPGGRPGGRGNPSDVPQMTPRMLAAMLAAKGMRVPDGLLSPSSPSEPPSQRALHARVCVHAWERGGVVYS